MVHLKGFSLLSPNIRSSDLFKAIEIAIPASEIEQAIVNSKANEKRNRSLQCLLLKMGQATLRGGCAG